MRFLYTSLLSTACLICLAQSPSPAVQSGKKSKSSPTENVQTPGLTISEKRKLKREAKKQRRAEKKNEHTTIKHMTLEELTAAKEKYLQNNQQTFACSCLERMITLDRDNQQTHRIELADLYMKIEEWIKADRVLKDYISLYPNSEKTEYASCKSCECSWAETLAHDQDQEKTRECLAATDTYLKNELYQTHRADVKKIANQCLKKLLDHEQYVCRFYIKRGKCTAAEKRISYIKTTYSSKISCEPDILVLECELAEKKNDHELLKTKTEEFTTKYPHLSPARQQQTIQKNSTGKSERRYVHRF